MIKEWFEDWSYVTHTATEEQQYRCIFKIPNAKAGPKEITITDPAIAMLMMSAFDTLERIRKGEK